MVMNLQKKFERHMTAITKRTGDLLRSRYGLWALGIISFVESALLVPIITDPFMVAYIIAHRKKTLAAVIVTTLSSVVGGIVAYITAAYFIDLLIASLSPASSADLNNLIDSFTHGSFVLAFAGAITPIPFTLASIAAGLLKGSLILFIIGAILGRIIRYGIVGYLTYRFADPALELAKKHLNILTVVTFLGCALYFIYYLL